MTEKTISALKLEQDTGPWSATYDGYGTSTYSGIQTQDGKMVALAVAHDVQPFSEVDSSPVARRLVACWNACQSLETEMLEQHALGVLGADHSQTLNKLKAANQRLESQRDELLAALRKVSTCLNGWLEIADEEDQRDYDHEALKEAYQVMQNVGGTTE